MFLIKPSIGGVLGMKENVGVIYDSSLLAVEVAVALLNGLSLPHRSVRPVLAVSSGWLRRYDVMMLVSARWSEMLLPGEWHKLFERVGLEIFSGRTLVPVATSSPLSVSTAPALRRFFHPVCVRMVSPVEAFFIPEGHFAEAGNETGATRQVDEWLSIFGRCGQPADTDY